MLDLCKSNFRSFEACRIFDTADRVDCLGKGLLQIPERSLTKCQYILDLINVKYIKRLIFNSSFCVLQLPAKIEALRDEYMRYAVEKCLSILKENHDAVETITGKVS